MSVPIKYIIYIERERVRERNCSPLQPWAARSSVNAYQTTNETHALEAYRVYMLREKESERARARARPGVSVLELAVLRSPVPARSSVCVLAY